MCVSLVLVHFYTRRTNHQHSTPQPFVAVSSKIYVKRDQSLALPRAEKTTVNRDVITWKNITFPANLFGASVVLYFGRDRLPIWACLSHMYDAFYIGLPVSLRALSMHARCSTQSYTVVWCRRVNYVICRLDDVVQRPECCNQLVIATFKRCVNHAWRTSLEAIHTWPLGPWTHII